MNPEEFLNEHGDIQTYEPGHLFPSSNQYNKSNVQKFIFVTVSEVIKNLRPTQWIVKDYIEANTMVLDFGDPAAGKSFVAIDKACCIATGTPYHGHDVTQGAVFYIAGEGHNGLARRFKAWEEHTGASLADAPLYVSERPAQFFGMEHAEVVAEAVQELVNETGKRPQLIVIDTLARNFGGGDENSTRDMNVFIQCVDELKNHWKSAALIVHHTGHGDKGRARGSMALKGALDHEYRIKKEGNIVSVESTKNKDGPNPPALHFEIVTVPLSHNFGDVPIMGAALTKVDIQVQASGKKLSPQQRRAKDILLNCLIDRGEKRRVQANMVKVSCVTLDQFREYLKIQNISSSDTPDSVNKAITRSINGLNDCGVTASYGDYIWLVDQTDKTGRTKFDNYPKTDGQDTPPIGVSVVRGLNSSIIEEK